MSPTIDPLLLLGQGEIFAPLPQFRNSFDFYRDVLDDDGRKVAVHLYREGEQALSQVIKISHLTRTPVGSRIKKMESAGFVQHRLDPKTEKKSKPTKIYSLTEDATAFLQWLEGKINNKSEDAASSGESHKQENTVNDLAEVLTLAVQRIGDLESRLSQIELHAANLADFDRDALLEILQAK